MPNGDNLSLPFLTREMLAYEHGIKLELEIEAVATDSSNVFIIGTTREGIFKLTYSHPGDGSQATQSYRIPDFPILLTVYTTETGIKRGEFWASIFIKINGERIVKLCQGYVNSQSGINWPVTQNENELSGVGALEWVQGPNPAANVEATYTVPTNRTIKVLAARVQLVTDANAANRRVHLAVDLGGVYAFETLSSVDQAANLTRNYSFAHFGGSLTESAGSTIIVPLPQPFIAREAEVITTLTDNRQATDNFGALELYIERFMQV